MALAALLLASATWLQCPGPADDQLLRLRLDGRLQRAEVVQITPLGRRSRQSPIKARTATLEVAGFDGERLRLDRGQLLLAAGKPLWGRIAFVPRGRCSIAGVEPTAPRARPAVRPSGG
ncbi:MAG: hypothetical protein ACOYMY_12005 [Prochlorococcaceae cyanobacterium]|jgi:hypothetical protein